MDVPITSPLDKYNLMMEKAWNKRDSDTIFEIWQTMKAADVQPNITTINYLIRAYDREGKSCVCVCVVCGVSAAVSTYKLIIT